MKHSIAPRRRLAARVAGVMLGLVSLATHAQGDYPTKPIRLIVPYPAGGLTDTMARQVADGLSKRLGQTVVVENKGGGSGARLQGLPAGSPEAGRRHRSDAGLTRAALSAPDNAARRWPV